MSERTIASEVTFAHPFFLKAMARPLDAGTYRLFVDEEQIQGLSFAAFRRTSTRLEIPAISVQAGYRQSLQIDYAELEAAINKDVRTGK